MNSKEQEYYDIDEKNRVILRVIEKVEMDFTERAQQLGESIERIVTVLNEGGTEPVVLELFVKELALIQSTLSALDRVKELDLEGYDIGAHLEAKLKFNKAIDEIKHLGKHSLNIWSVGAAYEKFIHEKHLLETYKNILAEFNKI